MDYDLKKALNTVIEEMQQTDLKTAELTYRLPMQDENGVYTYDEQGNLQYEDGDLTISQRDTGSYVISCHQTIYVIDKFAAPSGTHVLGTDGDGFDVLARVMYGGRICERGTAREIFYNPKHEYTKGLLRSIPNVNNMKKKLVPIAGTPINMLNLPAGCAFCTRCDAAMKICLSEHPEEMAINENHRAACWINVRDQLMAEGGEQNV